MSGEVFELKPWCVPESVSEFGIGGVFLYKGFLIQALFAWGFLVEFQFKSPFF